jgi:vacuolar protein-sorting-associated protein 4
MTWREVPAAKLREPQILAEDFFRVLEKVKPSVSELEINKCAEWTLQYGQEGA